MAGGSQSHLCGPRLFLFRSLPPSNSGSLPHCANPLVSGGSGLSSGTASLCGSIRLAYATLLRITQLEQQLFDSLFNIESELTTAVSPLSFKTSQAKPGKGAADEEIGLLARALQSSHEQKNNSSNFANSEVLSIIETISNATRDFLRPFIIRDSSVDELCKVCPPPPLPPPPPPLAHGAGPTGGLHFDGGCESADVRDAGPEASSPAASQRIGWNCQ